MSSISIIGLGNMARALAGRALTAGHAVELIGRDQTKAKELAAALRGATVGTPGTTPAGDIVILAAPYAGALAVVREYGTALSGKIVVDVTNPVAPDLQGFVVPDNGSGAQEIAEAAPDDAYVVKAFNTVFSHVLAADPVEARPVDVNRPLDVFIAGDDAQAKARVSEFVQSLGLRPWDTGELFMARALENVGLMELGLMKHSVKHANFSLGITLLG
ncbi:NAD(P)-binding domain-containing protein [Streptomyces spinosirectus]|jgi:predicted dinucleotide-binding enzyme|uniref:NADPH-dependent F420 reductase n=1 Tax=Streptomyces TaxID=1883 RepID=UPI001F4302DE|nr:NAD(P)-binding domain-containing protein [Streptomyces spinosirectus]UIR19821.1 NAD(P)-binding domain-containing protein [Streptomyces spinosirectus]